ncbi:hypothetical protein ES705_39775 [subsurface metagenome]
MRISKANGSGHGLDGYPDTNPENYDRSVRRLTEKIENRKEEICLYKIYGYEDAEILIIAYGCSARSSLAAVEQAKKDGFKVGLLQLQTLWPFPDHLIKRYSEKAKKIIVPELSLGQLKSEIERYVKNIPIMGVNKVGGISITPQEIIKEIEMGYK